MYSLAIDRLTEAGLNHYEVSNFARPGLESRHNQAYWRLDDYLGLGVGAHSCIGNGRFAAGRNTLLHVQAVEAGQAPEEFREEMTPQEVLSEAMWLGLRLLRGVDLAHAGRRSGLDPVEKYGETMRRLMQRGLLRLEHGALSLTRDGLFLGNQVFCEFA
jgi:oxygen-independent coproporphyrinogen-3 oxidase